MYIAYSVQSLFRASNANEVHPSQRSRQDHHDVNFSGVQHSICCALLTAECTPSTIGARIGSLGTGYDAISDVTTYLVGYSPGDTFELARPGKKWFDVITLRPVGESLHPP
jgi:hypothetical protein